jgi:hypothetical protein
MQLNDKVLEADKVHPHAGEKGVQYTNPADPSWRRGNKE